MSGYRNAYRMENVNLNVQKQRKPDGRTIYLVAIGFSLCNVISFTANTYTVDWLRTAKRTNLQVFSRLAVYSLSMMNFRKAIATRLPQPERYGNHHFKAVHVIANPAVLPDVPHRFLFRQFHCFCKWQQ